MKISNINSYKLNSLSFCKRLVATCQIKTIDDKPEECKIFQLNKKEDKDYFVKMQGDKKWEGNKFLGIVNQLMFCPATSNAFNSYSIENNQCECLGYVSTLSDESSTKTKIEYIETCPEHSSKNKNRKVKYIGESLMAFVVGLSQKEGKESVCVPFFSTDAKKFYRKKCGFKFSRKNDDGMSLNNKNYSKFIDKHTKKVGKEITYTL